MYLALSSRRLGHSRLTLNLSFGMTSTQPIDIRDRGGLFDIDKVRFALPGKDGYSRAIVDGDHTNIGPRAASPINWARCIVLRGGYGISTLRIQNQEVTQIAGNNPNTPALIAPVVSAARTVALPYTEQSGTGGGDGDYARSLQCRVPAYANIRSQGSTRPLPHA